MHPQYMLSMHLEGGQEMVSLAHSLSALSVTQPTARCHQHAWHAWPQRRCSPGPPPSCPFQQRTYIAGLQCIMVSHAGMALSEGQREAVLQASDAPVLILTGGPGCGKTTATATIVRLWRAMNRRIGLAAPTGPGRCRLCRHARMQRSFYIKKWVAAL